MAWIFDATQPGITVRPSGASGTVGFRWKYPPLVYRRVPQTPVLLDLGKGRVLHLPG
jgi:hypothetical protein